MPMYEFFCNDCNTIYTFFSRTINTEKIPHCPKNGDHKLEKMISRFAVTGLARGSDEFEGEADIQVDESKMERAMEAIAAEAEHINEDDPRQAANLMRKITDMTGLRLGDKMEQALSRMEAGEDPETIEQELGEMNESDLFQLGGGAKSSTGKKAPSRDEALYEM